MSDERSELDLAIEALRDDVAPPEDGGAATEAAILSALSAPKPPWWKSPWSIGGGGLATVAVVGALVAMRWLGASEPVASPPPSAASAVDAGATPAPRSEQDVDTVVEDDEVVVEDDEVVVEDDEVVVEDDDVAPATDSRAEETPPAPPVRRSAGSRPRPTAEPAPEPSATTEAAGPIEAAAPEPPPATEPARRVDSAAQTRFREAHRLQYGAPPSASLAAWDAFLRDHPSGPYADEARYYRAQTLVRLGRRDEARTVLEAFASGRYGETHRADARRMLDRLGP